MKSLSSNAEIIRHSILTFLKKKGACDEGSAVLSVDILEGLRKLKGFPPEITDNNIRVMLTRMQTTKHIIGQKSNHGKMKVYWLGQRNTFSSRWCRGKLKTSILRILIDNRCFNPLRVRTHAQLESSLAADLEDYKDPYLAINKVLARLREMKMIAAVRTSDSRVLGYYSKVRTI